MFLDLKCIKCNGFLKPANSEAIGNTYRCVGECNSSCYYYFSIMSTGESDDKLSNETFMFPGGKIIVNHLLKRTTYYTLDNNLGRWIESFTKLGVIDITPQTAKEVFTKQQKLQCIA